MLGMLMALTGTALILAGVQQPKAAVILPGGGTGPSRNELRAGVHGKTGKQKGSLTSGCPMLRVPKVMCDLPVHMYPQFMQQRPAQPDASEHYGIMVCTFCTVLHC